jgi:hypothetical protein
VLRPTGRTPHIGAAVDGYADAAEADGDISVAAAAAVDTNALLLLLLQVPQGNFSIYVYKDNDIVSRFLAGDTHSYEKDEVEAVLWALQQYKPMQQFKPGEQSTSKQGLATGAGDTGGSSNAAAVMQQPLMVDVGANVGTFLFKVAAAGYRVAAFEGKGHCLAVRRCVSTAVWQ